MSTSRQKTSLSTATQQSLNQQRGPAFNKMASMSGAKPVNSGYGLFDQDDDAGTSRSSSTTSKIAVKKTFASSTTTIPNTSSKPTSLSGSSPCCAVAKGHFADCLPGSFTRNADFSKSLSGIPSAPSTSASSINRPSAAARSRLVAPRIRTGASASRHSPYGNAARRPSRPERTASRMEDEPQFAPLKEALKEQPKTPEAQKNKTPEQAQTWASWAIKGLLSTGKKLSTADAAPAGGNFFGKLLFSKKEDKAEDKSGEKKEKKDSKRYSLPGSFEDVEDKENTEQSTNAADADPYLKPYKQLEAIQTKEVSKSFSGNPSTPRGLMSPTKRSIRGVAASFDESKIRTARYNFHPYSRQRSVNSPRLDRFSVSRTVSISPTFEDNMTEEERIKAAADEELRAIEQRKRDRFVQAQEDTYRLRAVAKKMGKKLEDIMPADNDDYMDEDMPSSSQETQPDDSEPAPAPVEEKKPERRGFGLFDDDDDEEMEEIEVPAPSPRKRTRSPTKSTTPSNALPFSTFTSSDNISNNIPTLAPSAKSTLAPIQPSSSKSTSPSPDSDKENSFFSEPVGPMPPAPHPAHATLPKASSSPAKPSLSAPLPPATPAKLKSNTDKFKPAVPSNLRASTVAGNVSPPHATKALNTVRAEIDAIPDARLIAYRFPTVKPVAANVDVLKALNAMWSPKGGIVDGFMAEFRGVLA